MTITGERGKGQVLITVDGGFGPTGTYAALAGTGSIKVTSNSSAAGRSNRTRSGVRSASQPPTGTGDGEPSATPRSCPASPSESEFLRTMRGMHGDFFRGDGPPRSQRRKAWPAGTKRQSLASAGPVHALDRVNWRRSQTRLSIASTTDLGSSCSQNLSTSQPAVLSSRSCRRSRSTFAASFSSHQSRLACGVVPCTGHECQKQPSRNTATRSFVKTKSGRDRVTPGIVRSTRKRSPRRCSRLRTCISTGVSR